jgi:hypothetical protein
VAEIEGGGELLNRKIRDVSGRAIQGLIGLKRNSAVAHSYDTAITVKITL